MKGSPMGYVAWVAVILPHLHTVVDSDPHTVPAEADGLICESIHNARRRRRMVMTVCAMAVPLVVVSFAFSMIPRHKETTTPTPNETVGVPFRIADDIDAEVDPLRVERLSREEFGSRTRVGPSRHPVCTRSKIEIDFDKIQEEAAIPKSEINRLQSMIKYAYVQSDVKLDDSSKNVVNIILSSYLAYVQTDKEFSTEYERIKNLKGVTWKSMLNSLTSCNSIGRMATQMEFALRNGPPNRAISTILSDHKEDIHIFYQTLRAQGHYDPMMMSIPQQDPFKEGIQTLVKKDRPSHAILEPIADDLFGEDPDVFVDRPTAAHLTPAQISMKREAFLKIVIPQSLKVLETQAADMDGIRANAEKVIKSIDHLESLIPYMNIPALQKKAAGLGWATLDEYISAIPKIVDADARIGLVVKLGGMVRDYRMLV